MGALLGGGGGGGRGPPRPVGVLLAVVGRSATSGVLDRMGGGGREAVCFGRSPQLERNRTS